MERLRKWFLPAVVLLASAAGQVAEAAGVKVTALPVPGGGRAMSAKMDSQGTIHLVFDTSEGPNYVRSQDQGKSFSQPIRLVDQASLVPGLEFMTWDMAVTADGTVHVAIGNNAWKLKLPKEDWGFFYTHLLPNEKSFTPLKNINHTPSEGFSLSADENGNVTAVWMADQLFANVSHDGGRTFGPTVEIDRALNPCNCCTTSSVYGSDGRLAILYREETDNERDMYLALWDQTEHRVTKTRVSSTGWKIDSCPMTYYSVTQSGTGFVAAWPTKGQIYLARLDADGSPISPKEIKTPGSCGMRTGILTIATHDQGTLVAWKKDDQLGWQLYDNRGRPIGVQNSAKSLGNGVAGVLSKDGNLILFR